MKIILTEVDQLFPELSQEDQVVLQITVNKMVTGQLLDLTTYAETTANTLGIDKEIVAEIFTNVLYSVLFTFKTIDETTLSMGTAH